jgi:hypothetical protein
MTVVVEIEYRGGQLNLNDAFPPCGHEDQNQSTQRKLNLNAKNEGLNQCPSKLPKFLKAHY